MLKKQKQSDITNRLGGKHPLGVYYRLLITNSPADMRRWKGEMNKHENERKIPGDNTENQNKRTDNAFRKFLFKAGCEITEHRLFE